MDRTLLNSRQFSSYKIIFFSNLLQISSLFGYDLSALEVSSIIRYSRVRSPNSAWPAFPNYSATPSQDARNTKPPQNTETVVRD